MCRINPLSPLGRRRRRGVTHWNVVADASAASSPDGARPIGSSLSYPLSRLGRIQPRTDAPAYSGVVGGPGGGRLAVGHPAPRVRRRRSDAAAAPSRRCPDDETAAERLSGNSQVARGGHTFGTAMITA